MNSSSPGSRMRRGSIAINARLNAARDLARFHERAGGYRRALHANQHHYRRRPVLSAEENVARREFRHARLENFKARGVTAWRTELGQRTENAIIDKESKKPNENTNLHRRRPRSPSNDRHNTASHLPPRLALDRLPGVRCDC